MSSAQNSASEVVASGLPQVDDGHDHAWRGDQQIKQILSRMELPDDIEFATLSSGMKRRVLLARALVSNPDVLLLDEPTNHLDLEAIRSLTEAMARYEGTCVFITHDRQMVSQVATRVLEVSETGISELSPEQFHEGQFLLGHARYQKQTSSW